MTRASSSGPVRAGASSAGFLLVEALTAMAIGALLLVALGSLVSFVLRAADRTASTSQAIEETSRIFGTPVLETQKGGQKGGGAQLSETGRAVVEHYRAVEKAALDAAEAHMKALQESVRGE